MSSLRIKQILVVVISQVIGFAIGFALITKGFDWLRFISAIEAPQGRSIADYGIQYFLWTAVPLGIIVMIYLDAIFETKILPD